MFADDERAYLNAMRALSFDAEGREIFVGLSYEETPTYLQHTRSFLTGSRDRAGSKEYLELHAKHEAARLAVIGAENQLRVDKPSRH